MIVILMGAPGAGKGTQADFLKLTLGFLKVSTGDLLRAEVEKKTDLGKQVEGIMTKGAYVSDDILLQIVKKQLDSVGSRNVVLDGFPRTVVQAEWLSKNANVSGVIHIDVDQNILVERIEGRLICIKCSSVYHLCSKPPKISYQCDICGSKLETRTDDIREKILRRLEIYFKQTTPVLDFYRERKQYFRVDGSLEEIDVSNQIENLLTKFAR